MEGAAAKRALVMLSALALVATGCERKAAEQSPAETAVDAAPTEAPPPAVLAAPPLPAPIPTLTRSDLVAAAATAASAFAEGRPLAAKDTLIGQRFVVRIPFGCTGPTLPGPSTPGVAGWSPTTDGKAIQLTLDPADWIAAPLFSAPDVAARWEAVEGFWIPRPWLAAETCPGLALDPMQPPGAGSPQTVGLAAVFERGGSRIGRRGGRAYTFTIRSSGEDPPVPPGSGYRLVLAGRIASFPDGRAFACRATGPDQRPVCVAAVELDRVAFEAEDKVLSEWRPG